MVAGHLQEKNGIYYVVLTYKTYDGKRKTKWQSTGLPIKGNKRRAEAMMRELQDDFEPPVDPNGPPSKAMLFADYLVQWLEIAKSTVKLTTYASYKELSNSRIIPYFRNLGVTLGDLKAVHKIAKKDVAEYLYRRESDPMRYTPPSGWYYNYPKHKKPASSLERKLNYKGEERLLAKEWYEQQLANYPDVLTVAQVCEVTGYQRHTILKWCSKGLLKTILQTPKYMIPKVWLLEFVTSDFFNEISRKCGKHYAAIKEISRSRKAR